MSDSTKIPIIMDVDTGVDDAAAIALAVRLPQIDLIGVTTVAGNVNVERTTANSLNVLAAVDATSVPVFRGMSRPLVRTYNDASLYHGESGIGDATLPNSPIASRRETAPEFIVQSLRDRPGEITLVCVAPLTNIAVALRLEPELPRLTKRMVIMGGAFFCPGNTTPYAEFNIWADPEAAAIVANSEFPITFIGLDVTHKALFLRERWEPLAGIDAPDAQLIYALLRRSFVTRERPGFPLHDPLALAVAALPELVETESLGVTVDTGIGETSGRTCIVNQPDAQRHQVAVRVRTDEFIRLFSETLSLVNGT